MVGINSEQQKSGLDFSVKETTNSSRNEMDIKIKQGNHGQLNTNNSEKADETLEKITVDDSQSGDDSQSDSQCLQCKIQFR